ncbi:phosphatase PAP2 family protein [Salinicola halimionae]|uniref:phosphatase PAP2 family protein n=1 Tax=Salinicola halimionae TaxID=1949081 RepID=UPI000DA21DDB|nr:phosphatase PAP2 family protein [Salinicola halimionae]
MHTSVDFERHLLRLCYGWLFFIPLMLFFHLYGIDFHIADYLYQWEGGQWLLRDNVIAKSVFHDDGRTLSELMGVVLIVLTVTAFLKKGWNHWRRPLLYLIAAVTASTVTVSLIKNAISMDCPWDLARYGGNLPFIGLWEVRPAGMPDTACFPAGHASAGYAWIALYFCLTVMVPQWKLLGLAIGLGMGLAFGIDQQLRGAHFLSHDLFTLMICWSCSALLGWLMLRHVSVDLESKEPLSSAGYQSARTPAHYVKKEGV